MTEDPFFHFLKAVCAGTLTGGSIFLLLTVPIGIVAIGDGDLLAGLGIAFLPLLLAGVPTFVGMVLVGLPVTVVLAENPPEVASTYAKIGTLAGALLPFLFVAIVERDTTAILPLGMFLALFGGLSGFAAGASWGHHRERLAALHEQADVFRDDDVTPKNPIHDLLF